MNLKTIFKKIYELKISDVLVEAGGIFFSNLLKNKLADELHLFRSPKLIGDKGRPILVNMKISDLKTKEISKTNYGNDIYQHLKIL